MPNNDDDEYRVTHTSLLVPVYWYQLLVPETGQSDMAFSNSQVIGCEDRLRNDLYCVGWGVKLYSVQSHGASNAVAAPHSDPCC